MAYKLFLSEQVKDQISDLFDFYESKKKDGGTLFLDNLGALLRDISETPSRWQYAATREIGIRRAFLRRPPVVVLFSINHQEIFISAVKDARSNWQSEI